MSFTRNVSNNSGKKLLNAATKAWLDVLKTASKTVAHKAAKAIGKFIGNKIANKIVKPKPESEVDSRNVEEIIISLEKKRGNTERIETSIIKWKLLNDSTASKLVTKKWIKVNELSGCQYSVNKNIIFKRFT